MKLKEFERATFDPEFIKTADAQYDEIKKLTQVVFNLRYWAGIIKHGAFCHHGLAVDAMMTAAKRLETLYDDYDDLRERHDAAMEWIKNHTVHGHSERCAIWNERGAPDFRRSCTCGAPRILGFKEGE
jgi:hypothetical protein